jgi:hypothetical protein
MSQSIIVCPILPFPNVYWWSLASQCEQVILDQCEHFEKMSFRNRYILASATGPLTLSIPIVNGRQQRSPMADVKIDNTTNWQTQHWRSLKSVYNRSPYFEFFAKDIEQLYVQQYDNLVDFSKASVSVLGLLLGKKLNLSITDRFQKSYPEGTIDIRADFRSNQYLHQSEKFPVYHQVFEDRLGFLPNLSLLDLLFSEGKNIQPYLFKV